MQKLTKNLHLHLMLLPSVIAVFIFSYIPMAGIVIAFQKFVPAKGYILNQQFIGFENFRYILLMPNIYGVLRNTITIALGKIVLYIIVPIVVALLLNEVVHLKFKRAIQTMIYFPYFLSWVVFAGVLVDILSVKTGIFNDLLEFLGLGRHFFLGDNSLFQGTLIVTESYKTFGFDTVIFLAAITNIDPALYEAAAIDGAGRFKQTLHITLPGMFMMIVLVIVINMGNVMNAGFDQIFNLYSPAVYKSGDVLDTLIYRIGLIDFHYGPATAVGLFKSLVSMILISGSYFVSYKFFDYRIF